MTRDHYSALRKRRILDGTIKAALAKRAERDARKYRPPTRSEIERDRLALIPLGPQHAAQAARKAREQFPRRQNWDAPEAGYHQIGVTTNHHGRYSHRCRFERLSYSPVLRSCGMVTAGRALLLIGNDLIRLRAPRGWRFGRDDNGLYLVRIRETREAFRYHPTSDEWASGVAAIRSAAIEHEQTQRRVAREARDQQRRDREDAALLATLPVYVCLRDSRRAGNCVAGTLAWARRHELDPRQHVPADIVRRLADRNPQAMRAVESAERRTLAEIRRGYSLIADH
jgi:hypothetical protein